MLVPPTKAPLIISSTFSSKFVFANTEPLYSKTSPFAKDDVVTFAKAPMLEAAILVSALPSALAFVKY